MPFTSEKQRRYMYAKHPAIAKRWEDEAEAKKKRKGHKHEAKRRRKGRAH